MKTNNLGRIVVSVCLLLLVSGCSKEVIAPSVTESTGTVASNPTETSGTNLVLLSIGPARTPAGAGFNVQPNGDNAIGVMAENYSRSTVIVMDGEKLPTICGDTFISAVIPSRFTAKPGSHSVQLVDGERRSNTLEFVVE